MKPEYYPGLVFLSADFSVRVEVAAAVSECLVPRLGVAFRYFGGDEGERGPEGESPRNTDDAGEDDSFGGGADKERKEHTEEEEEVGEEPGAAEGEPGNLEEGEEAGEAGMEGG